MKNIPDHLKTNIKQREPDLSAFWNNSPFPHVIMDDFLSPEMLDTIMKEFPRADAPVWNASYNNQIEVKKASNVWDSFPDSTYQLFTYLCGKQFTDYLSDKLGIPGLMADVGLHGGGLHLYPKGTGRLNPHIDYQTHPKLGYTRKLNLLIYLNESWLPGDGGELGFWTAAQVENFEDPEVIVEPKFNRAVLFETTDQSWHGVISPTTEVDRRSLALYYLVPDQIEGGNNKAMFAPTLEQRGDTDILELIERRKKQRIQTKDETIMDREITVAFSDAENPEFGVMTDYGKLNNSLYRFGGCPTLQSIQQGVSVKEAADTLGIDRIHFKFLESIQDDEKYLIATNVAGHPNGWTGHCPGVDKNLRQMDLPERDNVFECLPNRCKKDLTEKRAAIILDQTHEGYNAPYLWEWFYTSCEVYNVPPSQVIFVTGDYKSPELHEAYCKEHGIDKQDQILVIGHALFESAVFYAREIEWKHDATSYEEQYVYKTRNLENIKTYNCLQKRPRGHRTWFFKYLLENDLLDHGINTMNRLDNVSELQHGIHFGNEVIAIDEINYLNDFLPLLPKQYDNYQSSDLEDFADENSGKWQMMLNKNIMNDSWLSVISEASASADQCFLSEKIFKPLVIEHPFMVWGDRGTLGHLQRMGYKTFDQWWDESYDTLDELDRIAVICKNLEMLSKKTPNEMLQMFEEMKPVLKHNSALAKKRSENFDNEIKDLADKLTGLLL